MNFELFYKLIEQATGLSPDIQSKLLLSAFLATASYLLFRLLMAIVSRQLEDPKVLYQVRKTIHYSLVFITSFVIGRIWFDGFESVATFFGLLSAGLAIALKDLVSGIAGWLFILWRRPFQVGDRIQIGKHAGDVIDQQVFFFTMMEVGNWVDADQSTGRLLMIPNGKVFSESLANYSKGFHFIWNEIPVLITFESDWKRAKELLSSIAADHSIKLTKSAEKRIRKQALDLMILYSTLTPTVYTSVRDSGVLLTIRYLCNPRQRRGTEEKIWEAVLNAFAEVATIDLAYPTQRAYLHFKEGASSLRTEGVDP